MYRSLFVLGVLIGFAKLIIDLASMIPS